MAPTSENGFNAAHEVAGAWLMVSRDHIEGPLGGELFGRSHGLSNGQLMQMVYGLMYKKGFIKPCAP